MEDAREAIEHMLAVVELAKESDNPLTAGQALRLAGDRLNIVTRPRKIAEQKATIMRQRRAADIGRATRKGETKEQTNAS